MEKDEKKAETILQKINREPRIKRTVKHGTPHVE